MDSKGPSAVPHVLAISFVLFASIAGLPRHAIPQDQPTTQGSTSQSPCKCWIDVKTGKRVGSVPIVPTGGKGSTIAELSADGKTAFNTTTKQNFALEPGGCWIDVKTGKRVGSVPIVPTGGKGSTIAELSADGKTAFNTTTKQNFALEPCPQTGRTQPPTTPSGTTGTIDRCLVGTWRSESVAGASRKRGGSGILLSIKGDGQTTIDYSGMQAVEEVNPVTQEAINKITWSGEASGHLKADKGSLTVNSVEKSKLTGKETSKYGTRPASASGLGTVFVGGGKAPSPYNLNYACSETALAIKQVVSGQMMMTFNFKREKKEP